MPQIPEKCEFDAGPDQTSLKTQKNGDYIIIQGINLPQEQAAALAWLVNHPNHLSIEIKVKT